jgi:hypothetical protein
MTRISTPVNDTVDAATNAALRGVAAATDAASSLAERAAEEAGAMRDGVQTGIAAAQNVLGASGDRLAEALRHAAETAEAESMRTHVLSVAATGVSSASATLRDHSLSEIAADVRALARRHPGLFVAGAALAGFALARLLQAPAIRHGGHHD